MIVYIPIFTVEKHTYSLEKYIYTIYSEVKDENDLKEICKNKLQNCLYYDCNSEYKYKLMHTYYKVDIQFDKDGIKSINHTELNNEEINKLKLLL